MQNRAYQGVETCGAGDTSRIPPTLIMGCTVILEGEPVQNIN